MGIVFLRILTRINKSDKRKLKEESLICAKELVFGKIKGLKKLKNF